jgi:hypothetical protein
MQIIPAAVYGADALHGAVAGSNILDKATNTAFAGQAMGDIAEGTGLLLNKAPAAMSAMKPVQNAAGMLSKASPYMQAGGSALGAGALALNAGQQLFVDPQTGKITGNVAKNFEGNTERVFDKARANPLGGGLQGLLNPMGTIMAAGKGVAQTASNLGNTYQNAVQTPGQDTLFYQGAGSGGTPERKARMDMLRTNAINKMRQIKRGSVDRDTWPSRMADVGASLVPIGGSAALGAYRAGKGRRMEGAGRGAAGDTAGFLAGGIPLGLITMAIGALASKGRSPQLAHFMPGAIAGGIGGSAVGTRMATRDLGREAAVPEAAKPSLVPSLTNGQAGILDRLVSRAHDIVNTAGEDLHTERWGI